MAGWPTPSALLRGAFHSGPFSLRWVLLEFTLIALALGIWNGVNDKATALLVSLGVAVLLLVLAFIAQYVAGRTGADERQRIRDEQQRAEMAAWPRWKRVAFLVLGLSLAVGVFALKIWVQRS